MQKQSLSPTIDQLNALTDAGLISDLCVDWNDVAECDKGKALEWLKENYENRN